MTKTKIYPEPKKNTATNAILILPFLCISFFVYKYGIKIPYFDQWELVPLLEKIHNHTLTLANLWTQHNEHRIIFPQIIMLFLAHLSNWNISLELCTNVILGGLIFLFLLSILRNTLKEVPLWLKVFTSLMAFSTVQYQNWLWGWQIQIFMSVLGSVIAIWAADKWRGKTIGLFIIILAAILSSYSFNSGLITWPVVFFVFLVQKKWKLKHIAILILACIATVLLYYHKYTKPAEHPSVLFFMSHPFVYVRYVLTYLGASVCWKPSVCPAASIISLTLISLAIFNLWRFDKQKLRDLSPWLALALYSCMAACATGLGRAGFGWQQAFFSRYTTISLFLPLCAAVLIRDSIRFHPKATNTSLKTIFFMIITLIFAGAYIKSYCYGLKDAKIFHRNVSSSTFCLSNPQIADNASLRRLYPYIDKLKPRIQTLLELDIKFGNDN